jgi:hypothetical protein
MRETKRDVCAGVLVSLFLLVNACISVCVAGEDKKREIRNRIKRTTDHLAS